MTQLETEFEGEVAAVSQKANRYGVKIGEDWYGGFGQCPVSKGSRVVLRFYEKGGWKNIVSIRLLEGEESVLTEEEMSAVLAQFRERSNAIAEECLRDSVLLLKGSGTAGAVTPRNVEDFAKELFQRRSVHITWYLNRYLAQKRLAWRKVRRPDPEAPAAEAEGAAALSSDEEAV
ncbi:MAG: hypothetical protein HY645_14905 [Acidobacteria bacterium]|nr:hypothetical protein [Acidobacteriota bacterium]